MKSYYFPHDYNARNDVKVLFLRQQLGMEGYGIFWYLIECLADSGGKLPLKIVSLLSSQMGVDEKIVKEVINNFDLFKISDNQFSSDRLTHHLDGIKLFSESGKKGALVRWGDRVVNGVAIREVNTPPNANKIKEDIKKIKEEDNKSSSIEEPNLELEFEKNIFNPPNFPNWRTDVNSFLKDEYLIQSYVKSKKLKYGQVVQIMRDFVVKVNLDGDFKNLAGLKKHFRNYYEKYFGEKVVANKSVLSNAFVEVPKDFDYDSADNW